MMGCCAGCLLILALISLVQASDNTRQETIANITRDYDNTIPPKYNSDHIEIFGYNVLHLHHGYVTMDGWKGGLVCPFQPFIRLYRDSNLRWDEMKNTDDPVKSVVQLYILSIDTISEINMDFSVSMFVRQKWEDPRLTYDPIPGIRNLELDSKLIGKIWVPDLYFYNEKKASFHDVTVPNRLMHIYPDGSVFYSMRVTGTYSCKMLLHKYPLDQQVCSINMESYGYSTATLLLRWNDLPVERAPDLSLPQFDMGNITSYICDTAYANVNYTCIGFRMQFNRNYGYYVIQVFIPSILIVCLSWVSFWLNVDAVPARISLGLLTVLTMTTQSSGARESLPRVSYIKAIDIWMATCLFFVFAALVQYAYVNVLARVEQRKKNMEQKIEEPETNGIVLSSVFSVREMEDLKSQDETDSSHSKKDSFLSKLCVRSKTQNNKEKARYVDKISRVLFPTAFISFNIVFWVVYIYWQPSPNIT